MKIIKVINNNTVSVIDDKGKEQIISGKGIGFGKKYGDEPDKDKIQKMYLVTDSELRKRLIECLTEIPYEHIKLTAYRRTAKRVAHNNTFRPHLICH